MGPQQEAGSEAVTSDHAEYRCTTWVWGTREERPRGGSLCAVYKTHDRKLQLSARPDYYAKPCGQVARGQSPDLIFCPFPRLVMVDTATMGWEGQNSGGGRRSHFQRQEHQPQALAVREAEDFPLSEDCSGVTNT